MARGKTKSAPARRVIDGWTAVSTFALAPNGVMVAGENGGYRVAGWDPSGALAWQVELWKSGSESRYNYEVAVTLAGDAILALPKAYTKVSLLDLATGETRATLAVPDGTRTLALTPDGRTLVARTSTETTLFEYPSLKQIAFFDQYCNQNEIAISPDGKWLAVCGHQVHVFDLQNLAHVKTFEPSESPWAMAFTASSEQLVTGDRRNMLRVYDVSRDFALLTEVGKNRAPTITAIAVSPDGKYIAAANDLGTVAVHSASTLEVLHELKGHDPSQPDTGARTIGQIAFTKSGELVVGAGPKKQPTGLTIHTLLPR